MGWWFHMIPILQAGKLFRRCLGGDQVIVPNGHQHFARFRWLDRWQDCQCNSRILGMELFVAPKICPSFRIWNPSRKPGSLNVPIEHHPTIRYMVYNGYYKVMFNIPKMGQLPTPESLVSKFRSSFFVPEVPGVRHVQTGRQTGQDSVTNVCQIWALEPLLNDLNTSKKKLLQTLMTLLLLFSDMLLILRVLSVPKWIWAFQRTVFRYGN